MPLHIENETHWRTPDIRRLLNAVFDVARVDKSLEWRVNVIYHVRRPKQRTNTKPKNTRKPARRPKPVSVSTAGYIIEAKRGFNRIELRLPKTGPKTVHSNPMVAIGASAAAPADGALLSPGETFRLANSMAWGLALLDGWNAERKNWMLPLRQNENSEMPPVWADASKLLICKVKDPKKDGTYLEFVARKKALIARADRWIKKEQAAIDASKRSIKKWEAKKRKAEKALRDAAERRS